MKFSAIATIAATFAMFAAGTTLGSSQAMVKETAKAPIQVLNLQYQPIINGVEASEESSDTQPGIMVTFKNVSAKPVHAVVFAIFDAAGNQLGTVSRHGTFSPGVQITRYFGDVKLKGSHGDPAKAVPVEVGYKDGTQWVAK
jgi:hypothetical protein